MDFQLQHLLLRLKFPLIQSENVKPQRSSPSEIRYKFEYIFAWMT